MQMAPGVHILAEFYGVEAELLARVAQVKEIMEKAVVESKVNKLKSHYHQFSPFGVTGFVLLAESHISIHTWPEKNYLALDVFTCGNEGSAIAVYNSFLKQFKPKKVSKFVKVRGIGEVEKSDPVVIEAIK